MGELNWIGSLAKAEVVDGVPYLSYLVTGPEVDRQVESVAKAVSEKVLESARVGGVFLAPSHDVPIPLAKSADASTDDVGHLFVNFRVDLDDPLAMKVFRGYESGEWCPAVSLGAEKVTRTRTFNKALGKVVTEITDIDTSQPVHVALCFPGRNVYPFAGITQAVRKALSKEPDTEDLKKRCWPRDSIEKAIGSLSGPDWPPPPSFAARWQAKEVEEELPDMMQLLQWCVEDAVSPYTNGTAEEKRAMALQSVNEFLDAVLGDTGKGGRKSEPSEEGVAKTIPIGGKPPEAPPPPPVLEEAAVSTSAEGESTAPVPDPPTENGESPSIDETPEAHTQPPPDTENAPEAPPPPEPEENPALKAVLEELAKVKGDIEALQKASVAPPKVTVLPNLTTDPATAPHAGLSQEPKDAALKAKRDIEARVGELRKAINLTNDASVKAGLIQEQGALLSRLARL